MNLFQVKAMKILIKLNMPKPILNQTWTWHSFTHTKQSKGNQGLLSRKKKKGRLRNLRNSSCWGGRMWDFLELRTHHEDQSLLQSHIPTGTIPWSMIIFGALNHWSSQQVGVGPPLPCAQPFAPCSCDPHRWHQPVRRYLRIMVAGRADLSWDGWLSL